MLVKESVSRYFRRSAEFRGLIDYRPTLLAARIDIARITYTNNRADVLRKSLHFRFCKKRDLRPSFNIVGERPRGIISENQGTLDRPPARHDVS